MIKSFDIYPLAEKLHSIRDPKLGYPALHEWPSCTTPHKKQNSIGTTPRYLREHIDKKPMVLLRHEPAHMPDSELSIGEA